MPVPQYTPMRLRSAEASSRPLEASASAEAASANCDTRSRFAASASLKIGAGLQSTSAPTCTPEAPAISGGRRRTPGRASASAPTNCAKPLPIGETTPVPVMATRRAAMAPSVLASGAERRGDVTLQIGERLDLLEVVVGNADAEFLFHLEHELDEGERIDPQLIERRRWIE